MLRDSRFADEQALVDPAHATCYANALRFLDNFIAAELELAVNVAFNIRDPCSVLKAFRIMWLEFEYDPKQARFRDQFTLTDAGLDGHEAMLARHWA